MAEAARPAAAAALHPGVLPWPRSRLLGGRIAERESGRYEIRHVPADVRDRDRQIGTGAPVLPRYERVTFDRELDPRRPASPAPTCSRPATRCWTR